MPIVPRGEEDRTPGEQYNEYTSKVAIKLGEIFPNQISPRRVDHAIRAFYRLRDALAAVIAGKGHNLPDMAAGP